MSATGEAIIRIILTVLGIGIGLFLLVKYLGMVGRALRYVRRSANRGAAILEMVVAAVFIGALPGLVTLAVRDDPLIAAILWVSFGLLGAGLYARTRAAEGDGST